jgi:hypothetical protein
LWCSARYRNRAEIIGNGYRISMAWIMVLDVDGFVL